MTHPQAGYAKPVRKGWRSENQNPTRFPPRHGGAWECQLDVVVLPNRSLEILDTDELLGAAQEGLITHEQLDLALHTAHALVNRLSACGNDLALALAATGIVLNWEYSLSPAL